ncbi:MAG: bifunctional DNA primase/helicase [Verrucomicrobia bacterium]|nr:bifunctional DNA primase/helicase [Cytophagales bacterium]
MLTKEDILSRADNGLAVFRHFIHSDWKVGKNFKNPFYEDKNAAFNIFRDKKTGIYRMHDFGDGRYTGDCFTLVGLIFNLKCEDKSDFLKILQIITMEMNLEASQPPKEEHRPERNSFTEIQPNSPPSEGSGEVLSPTNPQIQLFSEVELAFWNRSGITPEMLEKYQVVSISYFTSTSKTGKPYKVRSSLDEPVFGYYQPHFFKIYRPFSSQRFLFLGSPSEAYVFGLEQLPLRGDVLFITGGEKDVLSLSVQGFFAICFNSETAQIPTDIIRNLSYRFRHLVLLYDTDKTGLETAARHEQQLKDFDLKRLVLPLAGSKEEKDVSDFFRLGGKPDKIRELFLKILHKRYAQTFAMLRPCEIDFNHPPPIPEPLISINGTTIGSPGNLLGITGSEGTGKSNFLGGIIAGCLSPLIPEGRTADTLGTEVKPNLSKKALLYYDTEQSEDQLFRNLQSVFWRLGLETPPAGVGGLRAYCLTHLSRQDRLRAITESMDKFHHQYGGIHLVVIDGIGDLVRSLNDESESISLVEELHRLAGIYQTCIVCVLHLVPSGIKLRGHLGSELQRKAAGILCIDKDPDTDISSIKALKVRSGSPLDVPLLQFGWDKEKGYHVFLGEKSKEAKQNRKKEDLQTLADELFALKESYTYTELAAEIQNQMEVSSRTAKSYLKFMLENQVIAKHKLTGDFHPFSLYLSPASQ